jgi:hypothetical protein
LGKGFELKATAFGAQLPGILSANSEGKSIGF